jgi:hypothetical protein
VFPPPAELLVRVDHDEAADALARLREKFRVMQVVPPRLAVVERLPDTREPELRDTPGVVAVAGPEVAEDFKQGLSPEEALFVAAWERRMQEPKSDDRPGDGLPWDAPGFSPPDPQAPDH